MVTSIVTGSVFWLGWYKYATTSGCDIKTLFSNKKQSPKHLFQNWRSKFQRFMFSCGLKEMWTKCKDYGQTERNVDKCENIMDKLKILWPYTECQVLKSIWMEHT
jgi:hypothetical protein